VIDTNVITALIALAGSVLVVGLTQFLAGRNNLAQAVLADQRLEKQAAQAATRESQEAERRDKREALQWEQAAAREAAQAERAAQQAAVQWARQQDDKRAALLMAKREEFLGLVLLAENRVVDAMEALVKPPLEYSVAAAEQPSYAARQAYAVALLYLADMQPLAKAFYEATLTWQNSLKGDDGARISELSRAWRKLFSEIEAAIAAHPQSTYGVL
jgi:hypothetical protein